MQKQVGVLSCDIGASGGRVYYTLFDPQRKTFHLEELSRFPNGALRLGGALVWNFPGLYGGVIGGLQEAVRCGLRLDCFGIDTWGNDFGLIDGRGRMLELPYCYRDARTKGQMEHVSAKIPPQQLYQRTGAQFARFNTLYQLVSLVRERKDFLRQAKRLLFIPDLLTYYLTGEESAEYTLASISQMYRYGSGGWDEALLNALDIPRGLLPPIVRPGAGKGTLRGAVREEYRLPALPAVAVGGHDTASAVAAVPAPGGQAVYISSGTWSIMGVEVDRPIVSEEARRANFANEGGVGGKIRFSKNIMGLWLIQQLRRSLACLGRDYSYEQMEALARRASPFALRIDPDDSLFYEQGNLFDQLAAYCEKTGQTLPGGDGVLIRAIEEGLALRYRLTLEQIERLTGRRASEIYIVGGGAREGLLCEMTADCTGRRVIAGPVQAAAAGNAMTQLIALGAVGSPDEARELLRRNTELKVFEPRAGTQWDRRYRAFLDGISG